MTHPKTTPTYTQADHLHQLLGGALDALTDSIDALHGADALPALTTRTLTRTLALVRQQLGHAHRMTGREAIGMAKLVDVANLVDDVEAWQVDVGATILATTDRRQVIVTRPRRGGMPSTGQLRDSGTDAR